MGLCWKVESFRLAHVQKVELTESACPWFGHRGGMKGRRLMGLPDGRALYREGETRGGEGLGQ